MDSSLLRGQRRLVVRKRLRLFVNRYDVFGQSRDPIAFVDAPRNSREVVLYRDDQRGAAVATAKARHENRWLDGFEVTAGEELGLVRAESKWGPRHWFVERPDRESLTGRERSAVGAFFRGIGGLFAVLPARWDFGAFAVHRRFGLPRYVVEISDDDLDRRLVAAQIAILDAY